jgi:hypothetical protein
VLLVIFIIGISSFFSSAIVAKAPKSTSRCASEMMVNVSLFRSICGTQRQRRES